MDRAKQVAGVLVLVAVVFSSRPVWAGGFVEDRPWLAERSTWSETTGPGGDVRGWWAVGNSRVFGIVGPGLSNAMIHQITGPHIMLAGVMNNGSAFGPAALSLSVGGKSVGFTKQTLSRVRGTNIVVMELEGPQVKMTVFNYAPFDLNALLRTVVVKNVSAADLSDVVLTATVNRTILKDGRLYDKFQGGTGGSAKGQTRQLFSAFLEPCQATGPADAPGPGVLTTSVGALPAGAEAEIHAESGSGGITYDSADEKFSAEDEISFRIGKGGNAAIALETGSGGIQIRQ